MHFLLGPHFGEEVTLGRYLGGTTTLYKRTQSLILAVVLSLSVVALSLGMSWQGQQGRHFTENNLRSN